MVTIFGVVDYPMEDEIVGQVMGIEGWALSDNSANDLLIEVFVDDVHIAKSNRNDIRFDVANTYSHIKNSDKSGFYIEAKLENFEDGIHSLKIIARTTHNSEIICDRKFCLIKNELLPPKRLRELVGPGDFKTVGQTQLNHFINLCNLKRNERVLEVGCGCGRIAVALTNYLSPKGHYEGFDVVPQAIAWNQLYITRLFPNFIFSLANVYNKHYNKTFQKRASEYKFPYKNESFDFVFLLSVFTHMRPQEIENYLSEISRVLSRNGRCLISFFLLNDESHKLMNSGKSLINFKFNFDGFASNSEETPELAIALPEDYVLKLFEKNNLEIMKPIHYGSWVGRESFYSQDIIVALKK